MEDPHTTRRSRPAGIRGRRGGPGPRKPAPGRSKPARGGRLTLEPLEGRLMLDAGPLFITEFMADNNGVLADSDGDFSDWIEIHNPTSTAIDLDDWYLTDRADELRGWRFPAGVSVEAGGYLVVFASGKNRTNPAELHTDFQLDRQGDYLALVRYDGTTISHDFSPAFPEQFGDVSYGLVQDVAPLVSPGAGLTYLVPTSAEAPLGTAWTTAGYGDWNWNGASGKPSVLVTEVGTADYDWVEIQNVSAEMIDTAGWVVAVNDATDLSGSPNINAVFPTLWHLPDSLAPGALRYRTDDATDTDNYWGGNVFWRTTGKGWAMILDAGGNVADFAVWGYGVSEINALDVTINGFDVTVGEAWSGASITADGGPADSLQRTGNQDNNNASDWVTAPQSQNVQNADLITPFVAGGGTTLRTGIGFNINSAGFDVTYYKANVIVDSISTAEQVIGDPLLQSGTSGEIAPVVNYENTDPGGHYGNNSPFPGTTIGSDVDDFVVEATAAVEIPTAGQWTFGVNSDDGFGLELSNDSETFSSSYPGSHGPGDTLETFDIGEPGEYGLRLVYFEREGGAGLELFAAEGSYPAFDPGAFRLLGDLSGGGLAVSRFGQVIHTDVEADMRHVNASIWTRIAFELEDPSLLGAMQLRMKCNDGFVAYLNGEEIARRNAPDSVVWNSSAPAARSIEASMASEEINVSRFLDALQPGKNVLAVHGLNVSADDESFLILPELIGVSTGQLERYFAAPTPGGPNGTSFTDFVGQTQFSVEHGFFESPITVALTTATPDATIRYTTDGSEPTEDSGTPYTNPLVIGGTTTLRAAAFKTGYQPSRVGTQTYIFLDDVLAQSPDGVAPAGWPTGPVGGQVLDYGMDPEIVDGGELQLKQALMSIPTMSLVTDLDHLFDPATGIYVNAAQDGADWERPTSLELIRPDGTEGFQVGAGLRIRGGFSDPETNPKHAFRLFFRDQYGADRLEYPLFGNEGVDRFEKIDLRTSQAYAWNFDDSGNHTMVRDVFARDTQGEMDQPSTRSGYYHLYVNGQYWGLYQTQERADAAYGESYFGGDRDDYDVIKVDVEAGYTIHATDGDLDAWQELWDLADAGFATDEAYYRAQGLNPDGSRNLSYPVLLDLDNLIDYMLVVFYTGDKNGPISALRGNNDPNDFFAVRNRNGEEGFRFFVHDAEHTLSMGDADRTGPWPAGDAFAKSNPQWIHQELMVDPEYRLRFADRAHEYLFNEGLLTSDAAAGRLGARADEIDTAIIAESARWGDAQAATPFDQDDWQAAIDHELGSFFPGRTQTVVDQLKATTLPPRHGGTPAPLYPHVVAPTYNPQHGGQVDQGFELWITAPSGGIYYMLDGSDPRLPGGNLSPGAFEFGETPISITRSTVAKARVLDGGEWSALNAAAFYVGTPAVAGKLAVTELNYHPHDPTPDELLVNPAFTNEHFEFIELRNTTDESIDLTAVEFSDGIEFTFGAGSVAELGVGESAVVVRDLAAFKARYGTGVDVAGRYDGGLNNGGEQITLRDRFGEVIVDFVYSDADPWPARADGGGSTLEVVDLGGDYSDGLNWRPSDKYGGSPGSANVVRAADVVVNEVLSQPLPGGLDAIELYNPAGGPIQVAGWYLSDSGGNYLKFRIPDGPSSTIPAGQFLVFDETDFNGSGGSDPNDFALDADGEEVWLLAADAGGDLWFADHVEFGEALSGVSFGRWPDGSGAFVLMAEETLGLPNSVPRVGSVVINEMHVDPDVKTEPVEFVELYNAGDVAVDLSGWYFSAGISYTFPQGTTLGSGEYLVVAENPVAVQTKYGIARPLGPFVGSLKNEGERVVLRDAAGIKQDEVEYGLGFPWPVVGDPPGYSMELVNPRLDNNLAGSWRASAGSAIEQQLFIDAGTEWRYFKGTEEPSPTWGAWRQNGFDDSGWPVGNLPIGYGETEIVTLLSDMRYNYSTVYLRKEFEVANPEAVGSLLLEAKYDDGINVWINGAHVADANVSGTELPYDATASSGTEADEYIPLTCPAGGLVAGTNVIAVQLLNRSLGDSGDAFFDAYLSASSGGTPGATPGARNSVLTVNPPPQMGEVQHSPKQPVSGEDVTVTIEVTDPDGVAGATLSYQLVNPGDYINLSDPRYEHPAYWTAVAMNDDGVDGDAAAGDDLYTVVLPGSLQTHRRLVRYRVTVQDVLGASVTGPYADDPQPNFAYYVYDGIPSWTGSVRPGAQPDVTYDPELLQSVPVYQFLTVRQDRLDAMHVPYRWGQADQEVPATSSYGGSQYRWQGTLIYNGEVYDHVRYRARGGVWRYSMGKNMWKFDFNKGHYFQAHDDYGRPYGTTWDKLNFSAIIQQGNYWHRGEQGLFEAVGFKLFNLVGVENPYTHYVHFRVVEDADEGGPDQFSTDFRGVYMVIEQPDGRLLEEHGLPDGNFYKMEGGTGTLNNQGPTQPTNRADLDAFMSAYNSSPGIGWWRANLDLDRYYSYRAIVEGIHHYDIGYGKNYFYYHNPETGIWSVHPWDLDLTWANNMYGNGEEPFKSRVLQTHPELNQEYRNRMREIRDLLYNTEQTGMLIDEMAGIIYTAGEPSLVDADCAMWDFNPILVSSYVNSSKAGYDRFYRPPGSTGKLTFADMIQLMKNYVVSRGAWIDAGILNDEGQIPHTPTVTYVGDVAFPIDGLTFETSAFSSSSSSFAAMQWRIARVTDPGSPDFDPTQPRHYEITATWESDEITTFDNTVTVPGQDLIVGETYRARVRMKDAAGRWGHWSEPVQFEVGSAVGPLAHGLRITELNYQPHPATAEELAVDANLDNDDFEFIELHNTTDHTLDLTGVEFTDGVRFDFTGSGLARLAPDEYVVVVADPAAFQIRYGMTVPVAGRYDGNLENDGERVILMDPFGRIIHDFAYDDAGAWPGRAEGKGSSLEVIDVTAGYGDADNWRASTDYGGSPGRPGNEPLTHVVVNEVLSHPNPPDTDAIELYNTTASPVDVGGWYLSNSSGNYQKFQIPDATIIPAYGYVIFDEADFNPSGGVDPHLHPNDFTLDEAHGDDVWLIEADAAGKLTHFVDRAEFGAAAAGESWGRWPNGSGDPYPMTSPTLDKQRPENGENSGPRVGPLIISEVHYNPKLVEEDDDLEFVEIYNPTGQPVDLTNWRIRKGIDYDFPAGTILESRSALVILPFALTETDRWWAFCGEYGLDVEATAGFLGGYSGRLGDDGGQVQLQRPGAEPPEFIPRLLEDEVIYDDAHPWPVDPDGGGQSLQRAGIDAWGNAAVGWAALLPTPGLAFPAEALVVGRHVFYNRSAFDGNRAAADPSDDGAIAPDKEALLPGNTATRVNYISYSRGINGIMLDVENLPPGVTLDLDDFRFRVGNSPDPAGWDAAPPPSSITIRPGAGTGDSDRVTIIWDDNLIQKQWLQVTVLTTARTGLAEEDVFYFGNAIGETGNSTTDAKVNAFDMLGARDNQRTFINPAPIDFPFDFNRDARVNTYDMLIARDNQTHFLNALKLITVPGKAAGEGPSVGYVPLPADGKAASGEAAARDAFFEQAGGRQSPRRRALEGKLSWLYEFEPAGSHQRPSRNDAAAARTALELLVGYVP